MTTTAPERLRLSRARGYRKPEGAISVARPGPWGNPFPTRGDWIAWMAVGLGWRGDAPGRRACAVALHRAWVTGQPVERGPGEGRSFGGGAIRFSSGRTISFEDYASGIALWAATTCADSPAVSAPPTLDDVRAALAGRDLACWCPLDGGPCHAETLLRLANDGGSWADA